VVAGAVIYVYRQVILTTLLTAVAAAVSVALLVGAVALTVSTVRWYRRRAKAMAAEPSGAVALATVTDDADTAAISAEADWLAGAGSELVFDKDGNLHAKSGS
jgi:ethanolamine utilization protein EutP (predicted NTPase)